MLSPLHRMRSSAGAVPSLLLLVRFESDAAAGERVPFGAEQQRGAWRLMLPGLLKGSSARSLVSAPPR